MLAGAALTVGSIGWTTGSWLQSRPWLKIRRDRLITLGLCVVDPLGSPAPDWSRWLLPFRTGPLASRLDLLRPRYGPGHLEYVARGDDSFLSEESRAGPQCVQSLNLSDALGARSCSSEVSGTILAALHDSGKPLAHLRRCADVDGRGRPARRAHLAADRSGEERVRGALIRAPALGHAALSRLSG